MNVLLRPATIDDLELLKHWDQQVHVVESDPNSDWDWEAELLRNPAWRDQLIAEIDQQAIGFVQIIDPAKEDSHYWGEIEEGFRAIDIWIGEASNLNRGFGTEMMHQTIERCFSVPGVKAILIDPLATNTKAHRFYKRLGFKFLEERMFDGDHCYVYQLDRQDFKA